MIKYLTIAIIIILILTLSFDIVEEFKNNAGPSKRERRRKRRRPDHRRAPTEHPPPHRRVRRDGGRSRRPHWHRGPRTRLHDTDDYYWGRWHALPYPKLYDYIPSWFYAAPCRAGCAHTGNGTVGCVNPSNSPDSCIFASDCYGC